MIRPEISARFLGSPGNPHPDAAERDCRLLPVARLRLGAEIVTAVSGTAWASHRSRRMLDLIRRALVWIAFSVRLGRFKPTSSASPSGACRGSGCRNSSGAPKRGVIRSVVEL